MNAFDSALFALVQTAIEHPASVVLTVLAVMVGAVGYAVVSK